MTSWLADPVTAGPNRSWTTSMNSRPQAKQASGDFGRVFIWATRMTQPL
jgi:hypothetical protein